MPNGVVKREDFDNLTSQKAKLGILFETGIETQKTLTSYIEKTEERFSAGRKRFEKIEKKALMSQIKDKGFSGMMGLIGGFIASYLKIK